MVHCQTSRRWAVTPEGWDEIPVHPDMRPEEILADIANWHTDLRAEQNESSLTVDIHSLIDTT